MVKLLVDIFIYSKTPIYQASRGKRLRPGKSGDPVNRGPVSRGFTVLCSTYCNTELIHFIRYHCKFYEIDSCSCIFFKWSRSDGVILLFIIRNTEQTLSADCQRLIYFVVLKSRIWSFITHCGLCVVVTFFNN